MVCKSRIASPFGRVMLWRKEEGLYYCILEVEIFECLAGIKGVVELWLDYWIGPVYSVGRGMRRKEDHEWRPCSGRL